MQHTLPLFALMLLLSAGERSLAQSLSPTVIATAGGTFSAGGVQLDQTIGEPVITTVEVGNLRLNQGFQQAEPVRLHLNVRAFLQGPYQVATGLMNDAMRSVGQLPVYEPYSSLGFIQVNSGGEAALAGVLDVSGDDAIVDWIHVQLRDPSDATQLLATRNALLQADGDVVDVDGVSAIAFKTSPGSYFISVRHRNHLGVITLSPVALDVEAVAVDLTDGSTAVAGTEPQKIVGAVHMLWAGDVNTDGVVKYTGADNDRDLILIAIGGTVPTNTASGYLREDVNLDAVTKYTGADNDRDVILQNIGGTIPTNVRNAQLP